MTSLHSRCWEKSLLSLSLGFWEEAMMPLPVLLGLVPGSGEAEVDGDAVLVYWLLVSSSFSLLSCPSPFFGFFSLFFLLHVLVFLFFTFYCFVSCPLCFLFLSFCSTLPLFPAFFPLLCLVPSCFLPSSSRLLSVFIFFFSRSLLLCSPCFLSRSFLLFSLLLLSRSVGKFQHSNTHQFTWFGNLPTPRSYCLVLITQRNNTNKGGGENSSRLNSTHTSSLCCSHFSSVLSVFFTLTHAALH